MGSLAGGSRSDPPDPDTGSSAMVGARVGAGVGAGVGSGVGAGVIGAGVGAGVTTGIAGANVGTDLHIIEYDRQQYNVKCKGSESVQIFVVVNSRRDSLHEFEMGQPQGSSYLG